MIKTNQRYRVICHCGFVSDEFTVGFFSPYESESGNDEVQVAWMNYFDCQIFNARYSIQSHGDSFVQWMEDEVLPMLNARYGYCVWSTEDDERQFIPMRCPACELVGMIQEPIME